MASTSGSSTGWAELPADLLGCVIARLPFPGDRAAICATCRSWRAAARHHVRRQPPWIVLPDCSVCTTGRYGAFFDRIPGLPGENATCLAAAGEGWLALDLTDDAFRRTPTMDTYCPDTRTFRDARPDVKHSHSYLLHNPFTKATVALPELDDLVGHVAETFEIRKVLMRSTTPDDVVAVTTNNWSCNIILCRPGKKGPSLVLPNLRVIDVAFVGDTTLYGITRAEELVAFHLGEDEDGRPKVTRFELVIENPMAAYYYDEEIPWSWPQQIDDEAEDRHQDVMEDYDDEFNGDGFVSDNEVREEDGVNREVPYDATDETYTARYLVRSSMRGSRDELLLVRHRNESPLHSSPYTSKVELFRADVSTGRWVPVTASDDGGLGEGEALFLSRSFSKSTCAHGRDDVEEGLVYYATNYLDDAFDTRSGTIRNMTFSWPWQRKLAYQSWLTWLFPPELVV
ncbi:unnamed protein product [Urochloa decumbens]|uniref:KIB1-4 beta-propeller domain-containing protein n=1 Tax=Urochloa decumbens TaxID=240449 RepID=A0ABC9BMQ7_9POAL